MLAQATPALEIVKLLPHKNCGECGEPLCMTFASQLLGGKRQISECTKLTDAAAVELEKALQPAVRGISLGRNGATVELGEERVLYRHELRFFNPTALAILIDDTLTEQEVEKKLARIGQLAFTRMGHQSGVELVAVRCQSGSPRTFADTVGRVRSGANLPLVLMANDPAVMAAALEFVGNEHPLMCAATLQNWQEMANLAKQYDAPLAVEAPTAELEDLVRKIEKAGHHDLVLAPRSDNANRFSASLADLNRLRRLAIQEGRLGYPAMAYPVRSMSLASEIAWASALVAKYASLLVLRVDEPHAIFPLLTLRDSVFTDPTVPALVDPGLYVEGKPDDQAPIMLTGNFAMTYSMVSSDIRSANISTYLLVADAQGYSVGVACLLGTITAEGIAALVEETGVLNQVKHTCLIIPGLMETLKEEIEEATKMQVVVGPIDSRFIPSFMESSWRPEAKEST